MAINEVNINQRNSYTASFSGSWKRRCHSILWAKNIFAFVEIAFFTQKKKQKNINLLTVTVVSQHRAQSITKAVLSVVMLSRFRAVCVTWSTWLSETDRDLTHVRRRGRRQLKSVFFFYFGILHLFRSIRCVCRY